MAGQARVFALDVEVTDFLEVEELLVKTTPVRHAPFVDVVCHVVDELKAVARGVSVHAVDEFEVDVVNALAVFKAVDQIQRRAANALDGGQAQLHGARGHVHRLRPEFQRPGIGFVRILHAKRQGTCARPMLGCEVARQAFGLAVDDEIDVALAVQHHVFGAVFRHQCETHFLEQRLQRVGNRRGELDKLEVTQTHGVVKQIGHLNLQQ